jgi:hypothetical protein
LAVATPARRGKRIGGPAAGVQIGDFDHGHSMIGFGDSCHGLEWGLGRSLWPVASSLLVWLFEATLAGA